jgi:hypothetical protein
VPIPVDLNVVLLTSLLNPVVIAVAFWMGRSADQWQKIPVAAFVASAAGTAAVYVAARLGVPGVARAMRAEAGIFIAQLVLGLAWAAAGYRCARRACTVTPLGLWLVASAIVLAGLAVWAFAPVLVFVALLMLVLGGLSAAMILLAHRLRAWRERQ